jgi:segregation and condensation protein B
VRRFIKSLQPPIRLTMPALETLAVIAYKQPATVPEINEIRGVNVGGVIKTLLEKRLITTAGRKAVIGRPILYRTSKQFLMRFGLSDLEELPSLKEFEQLAQAALGADEGVAPTEPDDAAQTGGEVTTQAELNADARETVVEAESIDASGEQSVEAELTDSPAESAAEVFAEADELASDSQAKGTSA